MILNVRDCVDALPSEKRRGCVRRPISPFHCALQYSSMFTIRQLIFLMKYITPNMLRYRLSPPSSSADKASKMQVRGGMRSPGGFWRSRRDSPNGEKKRRESDWTDTAVQNPICRSRSTIKSHPEPISRCKQTLSAMLPKLSRSQAKVLSRSCSISPMCAALALHVASSEQNKLQCLHEWC